jgi:phosphoenolpyruvate carboxykinase (GTP)
MDYAIKRQSAESSSAKSELESWVNSIAKQCNAKKIHWCEGSKEEYNNLCELLVKKGTFIRLNQGKTPK